MIDGKILQKIKREYIAGKGSQRSLAQKYSVSVKQIQKVAGRENWRDLRDEAGEKQGKKIAEQVAAQSAKVDEDFFSLVDQLVALTADAMAKTKAAGNASPSAVEHYANAVSTIQKIRGIKSDLDTQEQQAKIDKIRKELDSDKVEPIVVKLEGVLDDYA